MHLILSFVILEEEGDNLCDFLEEFLELRLAHFECFLCIVKPQKEHECANRGAHGLCLGTGKADQ